MLDDGFTAFLISFTEWMKESNYSQKTIESWRTCLGYFFSWAEERGLRRPQEVTQDILDQYQNFLQNYRDKTGKGLSLHTQAVYLKPLREYFKWWAKNNYISNAPKAFSCWKSRS